MRPNHHISQVTTDNPLVANELTRSEAPPWSFLVLDTVLLAAIWLLTVRWIWPRLGIADNRRVKLWFVVGALITLVLDTTSVLGIAWINFAVLLLYLVSLAILLAAILGVDPTMLIKDSRTNDSVTQDTAWERVRPAFPLIIGTAAAYSGSLIWWSFWDPTADGDGGVIDKEYFAQLSQVIPLLLVAVGLEAILVKRLLTKPIQREMTIVSVTILCLGEALAITALPATEKSGFILSPWHEYAAFVLTLEAVFVALALLVWALIDSSRDEQADPDSGLPVTPRSASALDSTQPRPRTVVTRLKRQFDDYQAVAESKP